MSQEFLNSASTTLHRDERRWDEHGPQVCMAVADGYVMCRRPRCAPTVLTLKDWNALSGYPLKIEHLTCFQQHVLAAMDQGYRTSREITDELGHGTKEMQVSDAMAYVDAFKVNALAYTPPKVRA